MLLFSSRSEGIILLLFHFLRLSIGHKKKLTGHNPPIASNVSE